MDQAKLKSLAKTARRGPLWTPGATSTEVAIQRDDIERLIPHRDPFLLIDTITDVDLQGQAIRGERWLDPTDAIFRGHFPGRPVYPGVLQIECIGQLGLCLLQLLSTGTVKILPMMQPRDARAVRVHGAEFFEPVSPGDRLTVIAQVLAQDEFLATCVGQIVRGGTPCSFGAMEVYFVGS
jgi:3-hydroxyacyl-[acyl-carrier-protein] dehydratase